MDWENFGNFGVSLNLGGHAPNILASFPYNLPIFPSPVSPEVILEGIQTSVLI